MNEANDSIDFSAYLVKPSFNLHQLIIPREYWDELSLKKARRKLYSVRFQKSTQSKILLIFN
jgi:hypothetical protein